MEWVDLLQWPAMLFTIIGAWMAGSQKQSKRMIGFWSFLGGNALWMAWGIYDDAWALIIVQVFLAFINIRGAKKNASEEAKQEIKGMVE
ncbi:MAG: hypothetical protein R6W90_03595 [Ignavibacteriaceae bacterium]